MVFGKFSLVVSFLAVTDVLWELGMWSWGGEVDLKHAYSVYKTFFFKLAVIKIETIWIAVLYRTNLRSA